MRNQSYFTLLAHEYPIWTNFPLHRYFYPNSREFVIDDLKMSNKQGAMFCSKERLEGSAKKPQRQEIKFQASAQLCEITNCAEKLKKYTSGRALFATLCISIS